MFGAYDYGLSADAEARAARLHAESTIIDVIWWGPVAYRSFTPEMDDRLRAKGDRDLAALMSHAQRLPGRLAVSGSTPNYRAVWDASGVTAGHYEVQVGDPRLLLEDVSHVDYLVDHLPWLRKALRADDFRSAEHDGEHAFYLQCQPTPPISRDLSLIDLAYDAGLRVLQLSYNVQDAIACGCTERSAGGVSELGAKLIARLNDLGVIVDAAALQPADRARRLPALGRPVIVSHCRVGRLLPARPRNLRRVRPRDRRDRRHHRRRHRAVLPRPGRILDGHDARPHRPLHPHGRMAARRHRHRLADRQARSGCSEDVDRCRWPTDSGPSTATTPPRT